MLHPEARHAIQGLPDARGGELLRGYVRLRMGCLFLRECQHNPTKRSPHHANEKRKHQSDGDVRYVETVFQRQQEQRHEEYSSEEQVSFHSLLTSFLA